MRQRRPALADASKVVITGLLFWAGAQLASTVFDRNETAAVAVQAAIAEWGAGRMGIAWSDPRKPVPSFRVLRMRIALGAGLGLATMGLVVAVALGIRAASIHGAVPTVSSLLVGLMVGTLGAVRDELLLRGFVLRATRGLLGTPAAVLVCGGAAAAARFGIDGVITLAILAEALRAVALGALWVRDRGAWMAVAASAAWAWAAGPIVHGGLFDVRFRTEVDASIPALGVLAVAAAAALYWVATRDPERTDR
jgi:hypothetical protein